MRPLYLKKAKCVNYTKLSTNGSGVKQLTDFVPAGFLVFRLKFAIESSFEQIGPKQFIFLMKRWAIDILSWKHSGLRPGWVE